MMTPPQLLCAPLLALLLSCIHLSLADQQAPIVIRGSGTGASSSLILKAWSTFEARSGMPVELEYRIVPDAGSAAFTDLVNGAGTASAAPVVNFATGIVPLTAAQYASLQATSGVLHVPFAMHTLSFYYNVPGSVASNPINITACLLASIFSGSASSWTNPDLTTINPGLTPVSTNPTITVLYDSPLSAATASLQAFLQSVTGSCTTAWTASTAFPASAVQVAAGGMGAAVQRTAYSIGYALTADGKAWGLSELRIKNKNSQFVSSANLNVSTTQAAVSALTALPSAAASTWEAVQTADMAGSGIYPATLLNYMYVPAASLFTTDQGQQVVQAFATFLLTAEVQSATYFAASSLVPLAVASVPVTTAVSGLAALVLPTLSSTTPWAVEAGSGAVSPTGFAQATLSGRRTDYDNMALADLYDQVASLKSTLALGGYNTLHGSGSSAISTFMWLLMDTMAASSASPIWPMYRAAGSGTGSDEQVGANNKFLPYTDFGAGDVPMAKSAWALLQTNGKTIIHFPVMLTPMTFFYNLPAAALPTGRLTLQGCTVASIFQGDITDWSHAAITADLGYALPAAPIVVVVRSASSGTTSVVTNYFQQICTSWKGGAGTNITTWVSSAVGVGSTSGMTTAISTTPHSIGYLDAGAGNILGLKEVAIKNAAGVFLKSTEADVPAAAQQLFKSGGFPTDPTADWSGVTLLNQPGTNTWPLTAMPCIYARPDQTARGSSGQLLQAFLTFMLTAQAQALLPGLGFQPLPAEVLAYTTSRALPLLMPDARSAAYKFELKTTAFSGAANNVISLISNTYVLTSVQQLQAQFTAKQLAALNTTYVNTTGAANASTVTAISGAALAELTRREEHISILTTVAIASLCFGLFCLTLGGVSLARIYYDSPVWGTHPFHTMASSMSGSVRSLREGSMDSRIIEMGLIQAAGGGGGGPDSPGMQAKASTEPLIPMK